MPQKLKYSDQNVNLLRTSVENYLKTNPEYGYSVKVAGFMVVPRTRDISLFDTFADHVNENTDVIVFTNYFGKGNTGDTITLYVSEDALNEENNKNAGLNGTHGGLKGLNQHSELRQQILNEVQNGFLKEENERLKTEVAEAKKVMKEVEVFVAQIRQQSAKVKDKGILEIIGKFATALAVTNPELLKEIPALDALISLIPKAEENNFTKENPVSGTPEVLIRPKQPEIDSETKHSLMLLKELRRNFSEIEFEDCTAMLGKLGMNKEFIPHLIDWLDARIEEKEKWIEAQKRLRKDQEKNSSTEPQMKNENHETEIGKNNEPQTDYPDYTDEPTKIFHP